MNLILLGSAVVPISVLGFVIWFFFRAARRNDEREEAERRTAAELRAASPDALDGIPRTAREGG